MASAGTYGRSSTPRWRLQHCARQGWWVCGVACGPCIRATPCARLIACSPPLSPPCPRPPRPQRLSADEHPSVADALAVNIAPLLAALPPAERLGQLGFLARMHPEDGASCGQWRMRLHIAEQLAAIAALLEGQGLAEVLLPATLRLCEDPVAAVREAAAAQLGSMVRGLLAEAADSGRLSSAASSSSSSSSVSGAAAGSPRDAPVGQESAAAAGEANPEAGQGSSDSSDALVSSMQQLGVSGGVAGAQREDQSQQGTATLHAAADRGGAADALEAANPAAEEQPVQTPEEEDMQEEEEEDAGGLQQPGSQCAAMVQQIVRHMVELQRSSGHRSRQTYLLFCSALLLPHAAQPAAAAPVGPAPATAGQQPNNTTVEPAADAASVPAEPPAQQAAEHAWPALPAALAGSGIVQGLLEGAVALGSDPVPNVRLGVARLLAALRQQQPQLAGSNARVAAALASLAADADRDVQAAAAE